uniref:Uncharacterized protein n=1 Tax=Tetradesmus obliquus TaxID=3088 RepID=A0A383V8B9_TETOB|eukprot:jgi/Sobl393_1/10688/SZX74724.1
MQCLEPSPSRTQQQQQQYTRQQQLCWATCWIMTNPNTVDAMLNELAEPPSAVQLQQSRPNQAGRPAAAPQAAAAHAAAAGGIDGSSSDISDDLSDVGSPSESQLFNDSKAALCFQLLEAFAGMHGSHSVAAAQSVLQLVAAHNRGAGGNRERQICLLDVQEFWFLGRLLLHLASSKVQVLGPSALQRPNGELADNQRPSLMQLAIDEARSMGVVSSSTTSSSSRSGRAAVRQLLECRNSNRATVFFTACFFCIPEVLSFLLALPELSWKLMLLFTKRGKQFYHILSTEAHLALRRGDIPHYQRLRWGLHVTLTALADKLQAELAGKTPEQVQAFKEKVRAVVQKAVQRRQQQAQQAAAQWTSRHGTQPAAAAAAAAAAGAGGAVQAQQQQLSPGAAADTVLLQQPALAGSTAALQPAASVAAIRTVSTGDAHVQGGSSSSSSGRRLAGHKRPHSRSSRWSADVLWNLHTYCLFHTHWSSTRSPPYDGTLLAEVAADLFGFEVRNSV